MNESHESPHFSLPEAFSGLRPKHRALLMRWMRTVDVPIDLSKFTVFLHDRENSAKVFKRLRTSFYLHKPLTVLELTAIEAKFREREAYRRGEFFRDGLRPLGIVHDDGRYWVEIDRDYWGRYGASVGHCGGGRGPLEKVYSLCDARNVHHLTCVVQNRILMECKGRKNRKPARVFLPHFKQLILAERDGVPLIRCYAPRWNPACDVRVEDFDAEDRDEILRLRPHFDDVVAFHGERDFVMFGYEVFFSERLTRPQFEAAAEAAWARVENPVTYGLIGVHFDNRGLRVPAGMIEKIAEHPGSSFELLIGCRPQNFTADAKRRLEEAVSQDPSLSRYYAQLLLRWESVPDTVMRAIQWKA